MLIRKQSIMDPKLQWFRESRIGLFIHFGLYSILAQGEQIFASPRLNISRPEYERLIRRFNPRRFSAREWVDRAEAMGARYITITAKHLDGFCLFDSALTDYKITNTPFGRDLIGELIKECHKRGMRICIYYSRADWHHRNYDHDPSGSYSLAMPLPGQEPDWPKYMDYFIGQLRELCTRYGRIDGFWFDAYGPRRKGDPSPRYVYNMIKRLQPGAIVNDRNGYGDFFTPERRLADDLSEYLHETCQALGWEWGYVADAALFSGTFLLQSMARVVGHGGNFLLNVGPKADGTFPKDRVERMRIVGRWLHRNAEAVYGALPVPALNAASAAAAGKVHDQGAVFFAARRKNNLYLLLPEWPKENRILLPGIGVNPDSVVLFGDEKAVVLQTELVSSGLMIKALPPLPTQEGVNVIRLSFRKFPPLVHKVPQPRAIVISASKPTLLPAELAQRTGRGRKGTLIPLRYEIEDGHGAERATPGEKTFGVFQGMTADQKAIWNVCCSSSGKYRVAVQFRCPKTSAGGEYVIEAGGRRLRRIVRPSPGTGKEWKAPKGNIRMANQLVPSLAEVALYGFQEAGILNLPKGISRIILKPGGKGLIHTSLNPGGDTFAAHVRCLRLSPVARAGMNIK